MTIFNIPDDIISIPADEELLEDELVEYFQAIHQDIVDESLVDPEFKEFVEEWIAIHEAYQELKHGC